MYQPAALRQFAADEARPIPRLDTHTLLRGGREVILVHRGQEYRLKLTAAGKLILTK